MNRSVAPGRIVRSSRSSAGLGLVGTLAWGLCQPGCSTTYQPQPTGRVGLVIHHAGAFYVKDGREVPIGPFSGELEGLTTGVPAAAAHARIAHNRFMVGVPAYLTGAAGIIVGVVVLAGPVGWIVIGVGASVAGCGLGFLGAGFTSAIDAVNLHNDAVSGRLQRGSGSLPLAPPRTPPHSAWQSHAPLAPKIGSR